MARSADGGILLVLRQKVFGYGELSAAGMKGDGQRLIKGGSLVVIGFLRVLQSKEE